jgi:hypothetical protein
MIELNHPRLRARRQCELVGLSRSSIYYQPACETAENLHQSLNYQTPAGIHFQQAPAKIMG